MHNTDGLADKLNKVAVSHRKTVDILGARAMVLGTFLHAVMPHLGASQCVEITRSFRQGIEGAMGLMDDVALSAEYHSALLELTNTILEKLGQVSDRRE